MRLICNTEDKESVETKEREVAQARRDLGPGHHYPYPDWFRAKVVSALKQGCSLAKVNKASGVSLATLVKWKQASREVTAPAFRSVDVVGSSEEALHEDASEQISLSWGRASVKFPHGSSPKAIAELILALEGQV